MVRFRQLRSLRIALAFWVVAVAVQPPLTADDRQERAALQAVHLVGHEDALLLQRVQDVIDDWDPRRLVNPVLQRIGPVPGNGLASDDGASVPKRSQDALLRADLTHFIADPEAAKLLGKLFFWDMQVGSDFRRIDKHSDPALVGEFIGTACASCHYHFGADLRGTGM